MAKQKAPGRGDLVPAVDHNGLPGEVVVLLESARRTAARTVNAVMTANDCPWVLTPRVCSGIPLWKSRPACNPPANRTLRQMLASSPK